MYDIIVVGGGPAGLTAALFARRGGKKVLVLEATAYGGQIINATSIENYPAIDNISGYDYATNLYEQVKKQGAEIVFSKVVKIENFQEFKKVITKDATYKAKAIILATGADNRKLGIPNEEKLLGRGVSYCATCDGTFFKKKEVAVVGGGNTAVTDAIYLSSLANKVYIILRRDKFRADEVLVRKLMKKDNIEIIYNSVVNKLIGKDKLEAIEISNTDEEKVTINVSGLFIAVGRIPENENFKNLIKVSKDGYVIAKEDCHTNIDGIFVAGDNRVKELRQLVTAVSDGAVAAHEAIQYLNN